MNETCVKCGGSGGGDDPVLRCLACQGTGRRDVTPLADAAREMVLADQQYQASASRLAMARKMLAWAVGEDGADVGFPIIVGDRVISCRDGVIRVEQAAVITNYQGETR